MTVMFKTFRLLSAGVAVIMSFLLLSIPDDLFTDQRPETKIHGIFEADTMYTVLPPGAIKAIDEPRFLSGKEAAAQMLEREPVIGIVVEGDARAYSMWHLDAHEIVNDVVGGKAIAITW
jgi:hypothetical protein